MLKSRENALESIHVSLYPIIEEAELEEEKKNDYLGFIGLRMISYVKRRIEMLVNEHKTEMRDSTGR
jgi:hypothetical protein